MPTKKTKKVVVDVVRNDGEISAIATADVEVNIEPIFVDFGREDLNLLRDKINEIISNK